MTAKKSQPKPKQVTPVWLDRSAVPQLPFYTICTSEKMFHAEQERIGVNKTEWLPDADALLHKFTNNGVIACLVCIDGKSDRDPTSQAGLIVHEAVHIAQHYWQSHGEKFPASENQAYIIQKITQELFTEYSRQTNEAKPNRKTKNA